MKQIINTAYYELIHIFKDKILFLLVFAAPIAYAVLFGFIYFAAVLTDIPLGIVDLDRSVLSREVVDAFRNSPYFKIIEETDSYPWLEEGMRDGTVRAGVVIPEDFEKKVAQHRRTEVLTVYDGSNLVWGYNIRKSALQVINQFNIDHTAGYLAGLGFAQPEIKNIMDAVSCRTEVWYNPTFNYNNFLFMGIVMMILHQIGLLSIGLTVTREKETNSWLQYLAAPVPPWRIFLGKSLPYFLINFFNYGLLLWFSAHFLQVKIMGSLALILLLGLLYNIIIISLGFFISLKGNNSLQVTRYLLLLSVPVFLISGYTWPPSHLPEYLNLVRQILPFTWMAEGFRLVTIKELGMLYLGTTVLALSVMAGLALFLALRFAKRRTPPDLNALNVNGGNSYPQRF